MRNLISFIIKHLSWFVAIFYIVISSLLLFNSNSFQKYVFLTSANKMSGTLYDATSSITSYFHLKGINNDLQQRNALLENELVALRQQIKELSLYCNTDSAVIDTLPHYEYFMANVINNSISKPFNYITIDKGRADGIMPEMGVVDQNGVIGIVNVVSEHYARVISLLNPNFRLSCKVKNQDCFGSLIWGGADPTEALLEEMPRHIEFILGDTIVTSGFSAVFPEGLIVGTIIDSEKDYNDNFLSLKIKLSSDFTQLSTVRVLKNINKNEIDSLEVDKLTSR